LAVFHYLSLHSSPYFRERHDGRPMPCSDRFTDCLVRLPLYYEMSDADVDRVAEAVILSLRSTA
jgi:dTDP-4-amino-4,6-dideoxygalactose transaminase